MDHVGIKYQISEVVSNDVYLKVSQGRRRADGALVTFREVDYHNLLGASMSLDFSELESHSRVNHYAICRIEEMHNDRAKSRLFVVTELWDNQTVADLLAAHRRTGTPVPEDLVWRIAAHANEGLAYYHSVFKSNAPEVHRLLHRHLSPVTISIRTNGAVKILHPDLPYLLGIRAHSNISAEDRKYVAPEVLQGGEYTDRSDVYSLGCILYALCTLKDFSEAYGTDLALASNRANLGYSRPETTSKPYFDKYSSFLPNYSSDLSELVLNMLSLEVSRRYTSNDVRSLPRIQYVLEQDLGAAIYKYATTMANPDVTREIFPATRTMTMVDPGYGQTGLMGSQSVDRMATPASRLSSIYDVPQPDQYGTEYLQSSSPRSMSRTKKQRTKSPTRTKSMRSTKTSKSPSPKRSRSRVRGETGGSFDDPGNVYLRSGTIRDPLGTQTLTMDKYPRTSKTSQKYFYGGDEVSRLNTPADSVYDDTYRGVSNVPSYLGDNYDFVPSDRRPKHMRKPDSVDPQMIYGGNGTYGQAYIQDLGQGGYDGYGTKPGEIAAYRQASLSNTRPPPYTPTVNLYSTAQGDVLDKSTRSMGRSSDNSLMRSTRESKPDFVIQPHVDELVRGLVLKHMPDAISSDPIVEELYRTVPGEVFTDGISRYNPSDPKDMYELRDELERRLLPHLRRTRSNARTNPPIHEYGVEDAHIKQSYPTGTGTFNIDVRQPIDNQPLPTIQSVTRSFRGGVDSSYNSTMSKSKRDIQAPYDLSPLMRAAGENNEYDVKHHLKHYGGQVTSSGNTALMIAASKNCPSVIPHLLPTEARMVDNHGLTALNYAAHYGHIDCIKLLMRDEAGIQSPQGQSALMAAVDGQHVGAVRLLSSVEGGLVDLAGETALMHAVKNNNEALVRELLDCESGIKNNQGDTALMIAAKKGNFNICRILLSREAGLQSKYGTTALMAAAEANNVDLCELLVGREVNLKDDSEETALMKAAKAGAVDAVRYLVSFEGGMRGRDGITALMLAVRAGRTKCAEILLPREKTMVTRDGTSALMFAVETTFLDAVQLLLPVEARMHRANGDTALAIAIRAKRIENAHLLIPLEGGIRCNGRLPLQIAEDAGAYTLLEDLRRVK